MESKIENIKNTRVFLLSLIDKLSTDQLNKIPVGYNNNIIWNIAHLIAAQQRLCYVSSEVPLVIDEIFFSEFKPGTKPDRYIDSNEIEKIKRLLIDTLDRFMIDYKSKLFQKFTTLKTRYGVELKSIDDAVDFLPYHEGLHSGYVMALKKLV